MGGGGSMIPAEIPAGAAEHSSYFGGELHGAAGNAMYFVHVLLELTDTDTQRWPAGKRYLLYGAQRYEAISSVPFSNQSPHKDCPAAT